MVGVERLKADNDEGNGAKPRMVKTADRLPSRMPWSQSSAEGRSATEDGLPWTDTGPKAQFVTLKEPLSSRQIK